MQNEARELPPAIVRGKIGKLTIYEVSESELETLERGSPVALYLNFAIFLLSIGLSFLLTLFTATIGSQRTFTVLVVISTVGLVGGAVLLGLWLHSRQSIRAIGRRIRDRVPPEGTPIAEGEEECRLAQNPLDDRGPGSSPAVETGTMPVSLE